MHLTNLAVQIVQKELHPQVLIQISVTNVLTTVLHVLLLELTTKHKELARNVSKDSLFLKESVKFFPMSAKLLSKTTKNGPQKIRFLVMASARLTSKQTLHQTTRKSAF